LLNSKAELLKEREPKEIVSGCVKPRYFIDYTVNQLVRMGFVKIRACQTKGEDFHPKLNKVDTGAFLDMGQYFLKV